MAVAEPKAPLRGQGALNARGPFAALALALVLAACAQPEEILPGERLDLRAGLASEPAPEPEADRATPLRLPAQQANASWTHQGGSVTHHAGHPALGAGTTRIWSVSIGQGNDRRHRITAEPVIAGGRIFTLDSRARVQASSASDGSVLWSADLTPPGDRADDASGGGLAVDGGTLYVTSGFGRLVALDAATGRRIWTQDLGAAATGAPGIYGDAVYVVSKDNRAWAVERDDGRIRWQFGSTPSPSSVVGGAGPAVTEDLVVLPFTSGELVGAFRRGGLERWRARIAGSRPGRAYARVTDITGGPVVIGGDVYTGNHSGRVARHSLGNGEAVWVAKEGAFSPLTVAGGSVFFISDQNELVRLDAGDGSRIWGVQLATFEAERPRRYKEIFAHYGPTLAGGRLWVASDSGVLRAYDPATGSLVASAELPSGGATAPVVAGQTLYVVGQNGQLQAFR